MQKSKANPMSYKRVCTIWIGKQVTVVRLIPNLTHASVWDRVNVQLWPRLAEKFAEWGSISTVEGRRAWFVVDAGLVTAGFSEWITWQTTAGWDVSIEDAEVGWVSPGVEVQELPESFTGVWSVDTALTYAPAELFGYPLQPRMWRNPASKVAFWGKSSGD